MHRQTFSTLLCFSCRKLSDRSKALLILYAFLSEENEICVWVCVWQYLSRKQATEQFWSQTFSWRTFFAEFWIQCFDFNKVFLSSNRFSCSSYPWILNDISLSLSLPLVLDPRSIPKFMWNSFLIKQTLFHFITRKLFWCYFLKIFWSHAICIF